MKFYVIISVLAIFSGHHTIADPETPDDRADLADFLGKTYQLSSIDDQFFEIMSSMGFSSQYIDNVKTKKPTLKLTFTDDQYTLERQGGEAFDFKHTFKMGEKFRASYNTIPTSVTFSQDGSQLIQHVTWMRHMFSFSLTNTYKFSTDRIEATTSFKGIESHAVFTAVDIE